MVFKWVLLMVLLGALITLSVPTFSQAAIKKNYMLNGLTDYLTANSTHSFHTRMANITGLNATGISASGASNLKLATFGGWFAYMVWQQQVANNNSEIFIAVSQNGGRNYTQPIELSNHTSDPIKSINPQVGAFGDDVYITWEGINAHTNKSHVYLINSTDGGSTFGKAINLSKNPQSNSIDSVLLVDKDTGKVLVGWIDDNGPVITCGARC